MQRWGWPASQQVVICGLSPALQWVCCSFCGSLLIIVQRYLQPLTVGWMGLWCLGERISGTYERHVISTALLWSHCSNTLYRLTRGHRLCLWNRWKQSFALRTETDMLLQCFPLRRVFSKYSNNAHDLFPLYMGGGLALQPTTVRSTCHLLLLRLVQL